MGYQINTCYSVETVYDKKGTRMDTMIMDSTTIWLPAPDIRPGDCTLPYTRREPLGR